VSRRIRVRAVQRHDIFRAPMGGVGATAANGLVELCFARSVTLTTDADVHVQAVLGTNVWQRAERARETGERHDTGVLGRRGVCVERGVRNGDGKTGRAARGG